MATRASSRRARGRGGLWKSTRYTAHGPGRHRQHDLVAGSLARTPPSSSAAGSGGSTRWAHSAANVARAWLGDLRTELGPSRGGQNATIKLRATAESLRETAGPLRAARAPRGEAPHDIQAEARRKPTNSLSERNSASISLRDNTKPTFSGRSASANRRSR